MGSRPGSPSARDRVVCGRVLLPSARCGLVLLVLLGAGCANSNVQLSTGGMQPVVRAQGSSALGGLIAIGVLGGLAYESERDGTRIRANPFDAFSMSPLPPALDPSRRVLEVDCTRPIEDWSANLRCR